MCHVELDAPVTHIWSVRGVPSRIGLLFDLSIAEIERVIYFAGYIITKVNEEARKEAMAAIDAEVKEKSGHTEKSALKDAADRAKAELRSLALHRVISEVDYHKLSLKFGNVFSAASGAEALKTIIESIDLEAMVTMLEGSLPDATAANRKKILQRLKLAKSMIRARIRPEWMFLTVLPVIPPDLRPMVPLDGGRHASSDVNDLYRRVINRNNRLKRLFELGAPDVITRNEKRMLQEAVDALIDNSMRKSTSPVASQSQRRALRSLADMLKGKQGRFRQNLLGKRVDYSGRSVIVVGPTLKMHQCGLPKHMALELFRPFVIERILTNELAHNIRGANRLIDDKSPEIWGLLEEVIAGKYVLLNRAPTLHRLGIQAFQPLLIEGNAIQLHPLVCTAFNADFDGDQMAVHVPLTEDAQKEARELMAANKNLLKPGTGESIAAPTKDIVLGISWLTAIKEGAEGTGKVFSSKNEAVLAYDMKDINLRALIAIRLRNKDTGEIETLETSVGRILFNAVLPNDIAYVNDKMDNKKLGRLMDSFLRTFGSQVVAETLDRVKGLGYEYATKSGISWGMDDLKVPANKYEYIAEAQKEVAAIQGQYDMGLLTEDERYLKVIEVWSEVNKKVTEDVPKALDPNGSVIAMVTSGARGSWGSITQMAGMKGLMRNPTGRIIELPILKSYKEGLSVFEYFISTHGARKGTADTALKTAVAGYLTRRLVDVAHNVVITEEDCGTDVGLLLERKDLAQDGVTMRQRLFGRTLLEGVKDPKDGKVVFKKGTLLSMDDAQMIDDMGVEEVMLRTPVYCATHRGVCQKCYGFDLGHNTPVQIGDAVGIVAAQAIGEPGTQLTMRTFHSGGAVGSGADITLGLPRVEEVFEARTPRSPAVIAEFDGEVIEMSEEDKERIVHFMPAATGKTSDKADNEVIKYTIPYGRLLGVQVGSKLKAGETLTDGPLELKDLYRIAGKNAVVRYITNEVTRMYALQGASINQKHVEIMVKQMFSRVRITVSNDSFYAEGEIIEKDEWVDDSAHLKAAGKEAAEAEELIMGIQKVAITTSSFLSAASFQETSKVLIRAALEGKVDTLQGLKENVIIGRLIPAGTGYRSSDRNERRATHLTAAHAPVESEEAVKE